jgi:hypothetical protein
METLFVHYFCRIACNVLFLNSDPWSEHIVFGIPILSNIFQMLFIVVVCSLSLNDIMSAFLLNTSTQANIYLHPLVNQLFGTYCIKPV